MSGVGAKGKEAMLQAFFCRGGLLGLEKWRERGRSALKSIYFLLVHRLVGSGSVLSVESGLE